MPTSQEFPRLLLLLTMCSVLVTGCPKDDPPPKPVTVEPEHDPEPEPEPIALCPSDDVRDVAKDPTVAEAMDEAWRRTKEGTPDEHEECFFVIQRKNTGVNAVPGKPDYYTEILWEKPGTIDSCGSKHPPRDTARSRAVAQFHTHPGPAGDPTYDNDIYSAPDAHASEVTGVPSLIGYGEGPNPENMKIFAIPDRLKPDRNNSRRKGFDCPPNPPAPSGEGTGGQGAGGAPELPACTADCGGVSGDPHIRTYDGSRFDFQAVGEFTLAKSPSLGFEIQARFAPYGANISVTSAIAARFGTHRLSYDTARPVRLWLDGKPFVTPKHAGFAVIAIRPPRTDDARVALDTNTTIEVYGNDFILRRDDGTNLFVVATSNVINAHIQLVPDASDVVGLLGTRDADKKTTVKTRAGKVLELPAKHGDLYGEFASDWRIESEHSLFDYAEGKGTKDFTDLTKPEAALTISDVDQTKRDAAETACKASGLAGEALLDCTFDFAVTGDTSFIRSARAAQRLLRAVQPGAAFSSTAPRTLLPSAGEEAVKVLYGEGANAMAMAWDPPRQAMTTAAMTMYTDGQLSFACMPGQPVHCQITDETTAANGSADFMGLRRNIDELRKEVAQNPNQTLTERVILGRNAVCQKVDMGAGSVSSCFDSKTGIALSMENNFGNSGVRTNLKAIKFEVAKPSDFAPPTDAIWQKQE